MTTRVLIADDHPTFRRGLKALFDSLPDIELAGEAADGEAAIEQAAKLLPDVVVSFRDREIPGLPGRSGTQQERLRSSEGDCCTLLGMACVRSGQAAAWPLLVHLPGIVIARGSDAGLRGA